MNHRLYLLAIAALLIAPTAFAQIAPEDVIRLRTVGAVAISPDGQNIAYSVTSPRSDAEGPGRAFSELFVMPYGGGEPVQITERPQAAGAPQWLPDGRLAFVTRVADQHDMVQVYAVGPTGGDLERLTSSPLGIMAFAPAPDGSAIFYTARQAEDPERARQRERGFDQIVFGEDERHVQLFVQQIGQSDHRALTPADMSVRDFAVSPDGRRVALQMTETTDVDADLMFRQMYIVSTAGGDFGPLVPTEGKLGPMAWSPDSRQVAFLSATRMSDPLAHLIYITEVGSNTASTPMRDFEGTAEWIRWRDSDSILFAAVEGTRTSANRLEVGSGEITRLFGGDAYIARTLSVAADGDRFAAAMNTSTHPNELFAGRLSTGDKERLTTSNEWLGERRFARQETIEWTGFGDERIEGVLVYPLDYVEGRRYPLLVLPHGGPEGISIDGWNTGALYPSHVMAREGYVVLKPNYRGSGGRGPAFSMANHRDLGGSEFEDVLLGIDHLAEIGLVDPDRVGISGTSYGGYFSAWATTRYPDRFRAGITFAGLSNWLSFMGTTDIPHEMALVHWDLYYWDSPGLYNDRSPVTHITENTPPTFVAHGLADERVHPEQSLQLYNLLRLRGVPTGLVFYPREPHGLLEPAHQLDFMQRMIDWFDTYVRPSTSPAASR